MRIVYHIVKQKSIDRKKKMKFISTRNHSLTISAPEAILSGPSPDGGLFMPDGMDSFVFPMEKLPEMSDYEIAEVLLSAFFGDFSKEEISEIVRTSYKNNFGGALAPVTSAAGMYFAELYHGPTCAFKDIALSVLPRLMLASKRKLGIKEEIMIMTATSGDTGGAALYGFSDVPEIKILIFYPDGGVSDVQMRQMVCCNGKNTCVCAVTGNFDDAQSGVKKALRELTPPSGIRFSSANSINIGRLVPQMTYYFSAYRDLLAGGAIKAGDALDFIVPTGNFGDILAGFFALKAGLPVGKLICASNENNVLSDFFFTGTYDRRRELIKTSSPSMDILVSSNLERLICYYCGDALTREYMAQLNNTGTFTVSKSVRSALGKTFASGFATEAECSAAIKEVFTKSGYLIDPHTAVAYAVGKKLPESGNKTVIISTASPYKFAGRVLFSLGFKPSEDEFENLRTVSKLSGQAIPENLRGLENAPRIHFGKTGKDGIISFAKSKAEEKTWTR